MGDLDDLAAARNQQPRRPLKRRRGGNGAMLFMLICILAMLGMIAVAYRIDPDLTEEMGQPISQLLFWAVGAVILVAIIAAGVRIGMGRR
jgi:hypothetical protein